MITQNFKPAQRFRYDPLHPEDELIAKWADSIRPEDRNLSIRGHHLVYYSQEERKAISEAKKAAQAARQRKFASECTPAIQGDDVLLELYGQGLTLMQVAKRTGRFQTEVKRRLIACHPTAEKLR
jgi:hypothetical protein